MASGEGDPAAGARNHDIYVRLVSRKGRKALRTLLAQVLHWSSSMTKYFILGIALAAALGCSGSDSSGGTTSESPPPVMEPLIQEGDIVWLDDPILYVLNKTNGLSVVGLGNPAAPLLIGRVALQGTPVELYLKDGYVLAINSDVYDSLSSSASRITVIDVRLPEAPSVVGFQGLSGKTTNSRLVRDVLYTASDSGRTIESVDLTDPGRPRLVDRLTLPLGTYGSHVLASSTSPPHPTVAPAWVNALRTRTTTRVAPPSSRSTSARAPGRCVSAPTTQWQGC
jgi:hypothetical protein